MIISLLIFSGFSLVLFSQTKISGVINQYGHVTGIGTDYVIVTDPTEFSKFKPNDTVLLIQMKGVQIYSNQASSYGTPESTYGKPGKHEFLLVSAIDGGTKKITFSSFIINSFDVNGALQIIKVPSFKNSAVVDNLDLTCAPWDSTNKTGGVLTMIVGKTLFLNKNIDVSGMGFKGGAITTGIGDCTGISTKLDRYVYKSANDTSGYKGDSPVSRGWLTASNFPAIYPGYFKGKGANFTGGGGGNGRFSGGGGGANYGAGGRGGLENSDCFTTFGYARANGGLGGLQTKLTPLDGSIFLGAGGGSSTYLSGSTATPGGNGGGIVIIICDEIRGNGNSIIANGVTTTPLQASGNAGAGGGGGGGSVALYLQSFSTSNITISANGGKGGNNAGTFGEGGGGGGGLIKISNITVPGTVTRTVVAGGHGTRLGGFTAGDGADGVSVTDFVAVLNGFLFNIIRSSVSENQADSVCSNLALPKIIGTKPIGGTPGYTYLWEKSYERTFAAPIALTNGADYTPIPADIITPTDTVFFRRTITDSSIPTPLVDVSKFVKFTVHPKIQYNNIIADPDSICSAGDPQIIRQSGTDIYFPAPKSLKYIWQDSTVGGVWGAQLAANTVKEYDPNPSGGLTVATWYRRFVKSGACVDKGAGSIVKVTVLNKIADNAFSKLNDTICFGGNTNLNTMTGPTGGVPGIYKYQWESSTSGSAGPWTTITGENLQTFDPDASVSLPVGDHFYRRKVLSGEQNACIDFSPAAVRKVWPVIINNIIKTDQTIGYDSIPSKLVDSALPLGGGSGTYKWNWVKDTVAFPAAPGPNSVVQNDYQPPKLKHTISFIRIVNSSVCTSSSNSVKITVDLPVTNTITLVNIALDTIYTGQNPGQINGSVPTGGSGIAGDYSYKWYLSHTGGPLKSEWTEITGSALINFVPGTLTQTTWFRRDASSPAATPRSTYQSNKLKVTVLQKIQNVEIAASQAICYGKRPLQLKGAALSGGDFKYRFTWQDSTTSHTWQNITGFVIGDSANYKPPVLTSDTRYRRIVYSGKNNCGSETSKSVYIKVNVLPTGTITSTSPVTICEGAKVPLDITLTGAPGVTSWTIVYNENSSQVTAPPVTSVNYTLLAAPVSGTVLTTFNYSLFSVKDNNGCFATSLTGTRKADVYKVPVAEAGTDGVIVCGPTITLKAAPSIGNGIWSSLTASVPAPGNTPTLKVTIDSTYSGKNIQHKFIWKETNWQCTSKDSVLITFDKRPLYTNPAGRDTTLYSFDNIMHLIGKPLLTWETGKWSVDSGTGIFDDETKNNTIVSGLSKGLNTYRWAIKNGSCSLEDILNITVYDILIPEGFSPNNDAGNFNNTFIVTGLDLLNQNAELKIVNGAGAEVFSTSNIDGQKWTDWDGKNAKGFDLSEGTYYYLLKLTSRGPEHQVFKKSGFIILKRY